jgi:hypothetical protein
MKTVKRTVIRQEGISPTASEAGMQIGKYRVYGKSFMSGAV